MGKLTVGALGLDVVEGEEGIIHVDHRIDILANRNMAYLSQFHRKAGHFLFFNYDDEDTLSTLPPILSSFLQS